MVEYIYDVIRVSAGDDVVINADIYNEMGSSTLEVLDDDNNVLISVVGEQQEEELVTFTIAGAETAQMDGRYWYIVKDAREKLIFRKPIYVLGGATNGR